MIEYIFVALSIIGALYVARGCPLSANILWSISNPALCVYNLTNGEIAQATLFGVFTIIAWIGVINLWRRGDFNNI